MEYDSDEKRHHDTIEALLRENQRLLIENNTLLRSMRRTAIISSLLRFVWFCILLGAGIYTYFTYIHPNLEIIKQQVESLRNAVPDPSALKELYNEMRTEEGTVQ